MSDAVFAELATGKDAICLSPELAANLGIQTCKVEYSSSPVMLEMSGTLMLDADHLSHVHARFPGEIVELGPGDDHSPAVSFGQRVRKGQLLAVIWSRDLGEKKSDLIDALSQLRMDEGEPGADLQGLRPKVRFPSASSAIPSERSRPTASPFRGPCGRCKAGVFPRRRSTTCGPRPIGSRAGNAASLDREEMVAQWAKLEVLAPLDGTVIERNVALGDLVDTNIDLFKIADLSRLRVVAHAYEEDLPSLDALKDDHRAWSVAVGSGPDAATRPGRFDQVGCIIDPNQHTAMVMGWVDNPDGRLRVGQFVTVHLEVPPPKSEVVIPASALC